LGKKRAKLRPQIRTASGEYFLRLGGPAFVIRADGLSLSGGFGLSLVEFRLGFEFVLCDPPKRAQFRVPLSVKTGGVELQACQRGKSVRFVFLRLAEECRPHQQ
jgi:hypothetical protein